MFKANIFLTQSKVFFYYIRIIGLPSYFPVLFTHLGNEFELCEKCK